MTTRDQVVVAARRWIGVPWRHQGRTRAGIDCIGLLVLVAADLGLSAYDSPGYGREPAGVFLAHLGAAGCQRLPAAAAGDGDIVLMHQSGHACHIGVLATMRGARSVIHATAEHRQVLEEIVRPNAPTVGYFRFPGVET